MPNRLASGGRSIKDHFSHEELRYNMRGVIANSSNIGTALLTRQLSKAAVARLPGELRSGQHPTGIELPGESAGIIPAGHDGGRSA